jgi:hypothetical protein
LSRARDAEKPCWRNHGAISGPSAAMASGWNHQPLFGATGRMADWRIGGLAD